MPVKENGAVLQKLNCLVCNKKAYCLTTWHDLGGFNNSMSKRHLSRMEII